MKTCRYLNDSSVLRSNCGRCAGGGGRGAGKGAARVLSTPSCQTFVCTRHVYSAMGWQAPLRALRTTPRLTSIQTSQSTLPIPSLGKEQAGARSHLLGVGVHVVHALLLGNDAMHVEVGALGDGTKDLHSRRQGGMRRTATPRSTDPPPTLRVSCAPRNQQCSMHHSAHHSTAASTQQATTHLRLAHVLEQRGGAVGGLVALHG